MRWPFRRRQAVSQVPRRPSREWAGLAPLRPVGLRPEPEVASTSRFQAGLATRWQQAPILAPLAHGLSLSAPAGLTSGVVTPVTGYGDAPELRWSEPVPTLPVVGAAAAKSKDQTRQAFVSDASQPVAVNPPASPVTAPSVDAPAEQPPAAEPPSPSEAPAEPEPPPAEPPPAEPPSPPLAPAEPPPPLAALTPSRRRLGRIGAPLRIDAVPPAVLRPPAATEPPPARPATGLPPPDRPALQRLTPEHPVPLAPEPVTPQRPESEWPAPSSRPPAEQPMSDAEPVARLAEPTAVEALPVVPAPAPGLGVPDWFATPAAHADPDEPVSARWVAPAARPTEARPTEVRGRTATDEVPPARSAGVKATAAAELPFRPFRRFGPGPRSVPMTEPAPVVTENQPLTLDDASVREPEPVADEPPRPAQPAGERALPLPRVIAQPRPERETAARPLASVRRTLSFLPSEGVAVLPGLAREQPPSDEPASQPGSEPAAEGWAPLPGIAPAVPANPGNPAMPADLPPELASLLNTASTLPTLAPPPPAPQPPQPRHRLAHIGPPVSEPRPEPPPEPDWPAPTPTQTPTPQQPMPPPQPAPVAIESDPDDDPESGGEHLDGLAGELYDRIRDRLRRELLVDRERAVMLTDWR